MVIVQLPDGASLQRTERAMDELAEICRREPRRRADDRDRRTVAARQQRLARQRRNHLPDVQGLEQTTARARTSSPSTTMLSARLARYQDARTMVLVPPPIQGLGLVGRLPDAGRADRRQRGLRAPPERRRPRSSPAPRRIRRSAWRSRRCAPPCRRSPSRREDAGREPRRQRRRRLRTVQAYLGSSFVNQFMRFGHQYMVYAQADAPFRRETGSLAGYYIRAGGGQMVPLGTLASLEKSRGPRSSRSTTCTRRPRSTGPQPRVQLRSGDAGDGEDRGRDPARRG